MIYEGTYPSLLQGVSQQTPQERSDGQLASQINMLSDAVTGLRRRGGYKYNGTLDVPEDSYINVVQLNGEYYVQCVTPQGRLRISLFSTGAVLLDGTYPYLVGASKDTIRTSMSRNQCFLLNTTQIPVKALEATTVISSKPESENKVFAWCMYTTSITTQATIYTTDTLRVTCVGLPTIDVLQVWQHSGNTANTYNAVQRASAIAAKLMANPNFVANYNLERNSQTLSIWGKSLSTPKVVVTANTTNGSLPSVSGTSTTFTRAAVPNTLASAYQGYYLDAPTRIIYDGVRRLWVDPTTPINVLNPKGFGWVRVLSGAFAKQYTVTIAQGTPAALVFSITTDGSTAAGATPEFVAQQLELAMNASADFTTRFAVYRDGTTLAIQALLPTDQLIVDSAGGDTYITSSGASTIRNKDYLPPTLPSILDGYIQGVGIAGNLAYYQYTHKTRSWKESGTYEASYTIQNTPMYWYFNDTTDAIIVGSLDVKGRTAGDNDNNPEPAFLSYGITGISAYQSRLVFLSGSYVCMSKSTDPTVFMRSTVTEVLDDDPIEISATSLSNAQFEYAIPYNNNLFLVSQTQQAIIPSNNTVLTPKTAVIYPSTQSEVSLKCQPTVIARSLYFVYQRGAEYYQVGEFVPNQYTDSQYIGQNLCDHMPLYATGVCTGIVGSTVNNMAVACSDTNELLINQYIWRGDERVIMSFHKWVLPHKVVYSTFIQEFHIVFMSTPNGVVIGTNNVQINQLGTKPAPYLDLYQYVTVVDGKGVAPEYLPDGELVGVIYNSTTARHSEVKIVVLDGTITCAYNGEIAVGVRYSSSFSLTPPFLKDDKGKVLAGTKSTIQSLTMTMKGTGSFNYNVQDSYGEVYDGTGTALFWSEVDLGYTWVNSVQSVVIPCRTSLSTTDVTLETSSTTDLHLISTAYAIRASRKHQVRSK